MVSTKLILPLIVLLVILGPNSIVGQLSPSSITSDFGNNLVDANNNNDSQAMRQSDETVRVDPLNNFKKYRGGYDITNKHYWSSTAFTGVYGYAIGIIWLLSGLIYGAYLVATKFCCKTRRNRNSKKKSTCHKQCYLWPILLAILFIILAITASGVVLGGNSQFHSRAKTVVNIIIDTANGASETIYETTRALKEMRDNLGASNDTSDETSQASSFLISTSQQLDREASEIERQARKNRHLVDMGLQIVFVLTAVTVALNLAVVVALAVCETFRFRRALYLLIALCWFLTVFCWLLFGVFFFLEKFSTDSCSALETFQEDPYNNSLSSILPCDELLSAQPVLADVSSGIYNLVNEVNANISEQFPNIVQVCNPFSGPPDYQYHPGNCASNTIRIGDIPEVLKLLTCSDNGTCGDGQFISMEVSRTMEAYTTSINAFLDVYPGMESLVECQSVRDAFDEILSKHCDPLKRNAKMVWAPMLVLSVVMVFLVCLWTFQTHHALDASVKPHSTTVPPDQVAV